MRQPDKFLEILTHWCYYDFMRMRFEKDLQSFSELSKEEAANDKGSEMNELSGVIDWHLKKAAERQHTDTETQQEIYAIQKKKQLIMKRLKEQLACLDNPDCRNEGEKGDRPAKFDDLEDAFIYEDDNNRKREATFGEITTDMDWDVYYNLDERSVPRPMAKKYLVERAKNNLKKLLDTQIIKSETKGDISHKWRKEAYLTVFKERASGKEKKKAGFISEIMVKNLLKKMNIDADAPFQIKESDIFQDVEQKIDFIIHRKEKRRGVRVQENETIKDVGIQFSINPKAAEKKKEQVQKAKKELQKGAGEIDDIVLVIFPIKIAAELREKWEKGGRLAGGPGKLLQRDMAKEIFANLTKNILSKEEIGDCWNMYESRLS